MFFAFFYVALNIFLQKSDTAGRAFHHGKGRKRSLPASTDKEPALRKKFGIEVQQSTTRISEFGGSITAVWVTVSLCCALHYYEKSFLANEQKLMFLVTELFFVSFSLLRRFICLALLYLYLFISL